MSEEIKKLETLYDLTSHPGWSILLEDLEQRIEAIKESLTRGEVSAYDLGLAQAHVKVYRELIYLREMTDAAIKQMQEDLNEVDSI